MGGVPQEMYQYVETAETYGGGSTQRPESPRKSQRGPTLDQRLVPLSVPGNGLGPQDF